MTKSLYDFIKEFEKQQLNEIGDVAWDSEPAASASSPMATENPKDVIKLDVPLLIRLLEYAREDAKTDMDLHNVSDKLIELGSQHDQVLTMDHYNDIVANKAVVHEEDEEQDPISAAAFKDGDRVQLKPEYADNDPYEIFWVTQCEPHRRRCYIADKQGRGWSVNFGQIQKARRRPSPRW